MYIFSVGSPFLMIVSWGAYASNTSASAMDVMKLLVSSSGAPLKKGTFSTHSRLQNTATSPRSMGLIWTSKSW